jgi:hypothetical protein
MADLVIKESELKQLDTIIGEIPMKYGYPLLNFINAVVVQRQKEAAEKASPVASTPASTEGGDGVTGE